MRTSATTSAWWSMPSPRCWKCPSADIEPAPSFGAKIRADFIAGMGKIAGKFVIILDIQKVLSVDEIATGWTAISTSWFWISVAMSSPTAPIPS
jgi:hypothetical protein